MSLNTCKLILCAMIIPLVFAATYVGLTMGWGLQVQSWGWLIGSWVTVGLLQGIAGALK